MTGRRTWRVRYRYRDDPVVLMSTFDSLVDAWRFMKQARRNGWKAKIG